MRPVTRPQLAELYGVSEFLIALWEAQGMPVAESTARRGTVLADDGPDWWKVTRTDLAKGWKVHRDTITDWLKQGLDDAVTEPGGAGKDMILDWRRAEQWKLTRAGELEKIHQQDRELLQAITAVIGSPRDLARAPRSRRRKRARRAE